MNDRDALKSTPLNKQEQSELLGRLFADEELITSTQISCAKKEMNKPTYDYNCDNDNAWAFYNHITHSLKKSPPRDWMQDSQNFHDFMMSEVSSKNTMNTLTDVDYSNITDKNVIEVDEEVSSLQLSYELNPDM
jgi:hypothetical protein